MNHIQRFKIGYSSDEWGQRSSTPSGIPYADGQWVRFVDHVAAVAALSQQGEPVAYHFQKHNCFGQFVWDVAFSAPRDATQCFPLYAAPQPAQQPLSDGDIDAFAIKHWGDMRGSPLKKLRAFARAVEAAHNITGGTP